MFSIKCWSLAAMMVYLGSNSVYGDMPHMPGHMPPAVLECVKEFGFTEEKIKELKHNDNFEGVDPCLFKCFFMGPGIIGEDGMYSVEKAMEFKREFMMKKPEFLAKMDKMKQDCVTVNEKEVSDGAKGCDRALYLFQCIGEHHHAFANGGE